MKIISERFKSAKEYYDFLQQEKELVGRSNSVSYKEYIKQMDHLNAWEEEFYNNHDKPETK